jgi:hypothetical protein
MSKRPPDDPSAEDDEPGDSQKLRDMETAMRDLLQALSFKHDEHDESAAPPRPPDSDTNLAAERPVLAEPPAAADPLALLKTLAETRSGELAADSIEQGKGLRRPASRLDRLMTVLERHPKATWTGIAVVSVLVFGALAAVIWDIMAPRDLAREAQVTAPGQAPAAPAAPAPTPSAEAMRPGAVATDIQSIIQAMKDCDDEAAKDPDTMYFLVIPLAPAIRPVEEWTAKGESYDTFILLPSKVMMDGLGDRSLVPRSLQYSLSLYDALTRRSYPLGAGSGVLKSAQRNAAWLGNFRLGFDLTGSGQKPKWSNEFSRRKGVCYWVNVMFRT